MELMIIDRQADPWLWAQLDSLTAEEIATGHVDIDDAIFNRFYSEVSRTGTHLNESAKKAWAAYSAHCHPPAATYPVLSNGTPTQLDAGTKRVAASVEVQSKEFRELRRAFEGNTETLEKGFAQLSTDIRTHGYDMFGSKWVWCWRIAVLVLIILFGVVLASKAAPNDHKPFNIIHPPLAVPQGPGPAPLTRVNLWQIAGTNVSSSLYNPTYMALQVDCVNGCSGGGGGGGTSYMDTATFTQGTSDYNPVGGIYTTSITALTTGQGGVAALTAQRALHITPYSSGGTESFTSGNAGYVQFPSAQTVVGGGTAGSPGSAVLTIQGIGSGTAVPVSGTFYQATQPVSNGGTFAVQDATVEGAISASVMQVNTKQIGGTAVVADPCQANAKTTLPINEATSSTTKIISGTTAKHTYICSILLVSATAQNVNIITGTGSNCGTAHAGLFGGTTAATGPNLSANNGWTLGNGAATVAGGNDTAADDTCYTSSSTGQVSGVLTFVQQ